MTCDQADSRARDLLVRHVNTAHGNQDPAPSPFRVINLKAGSFDKKKECPPMVPQSDLVGTSSSYCSEVPSVIAFPDDRNGATMHVLPSPLDKDSINSGTIVDAADDPFLGIDDLSTPSFDIDQFMVFSPVFPPIEPLFSTRHEESASVATPDVPASEHSASSTGSFDSLGGLRDISVPRSTEREVYWDFSDDEWLSFDTEIKLCHATLSYPCPSRQNMSRYMAAYFRNYHEHLPFLHAHTINLKDAEAHLILAIAMIGAQYCLETNTVASLFAIAKTIVLEKIEMRRRMAMQHATSHPYPASSQPAEANGREDLIQTCQTLLLLMVTATWGNVRSTLKEDVNLRDILATYVREENLLGINSPDNTCWREWVRGEGARRTILIIFCFFNFHTILYNVPPTILNSEIHMLLPCDEEEWRCSTAASWEEEHRKRADLPPDFSTAFKSLLQPTQETSLRTCSSLGVYILISAVIQRIYLVRQLGKHLAHEEDAAAPMGVKNLYQALGRWQQIWEMDPHRSVAPGNPHGPLPFNSIAQFRMAYIRLSMDIGSFFTLESHDPEQIAMEMIRSPTISRSQYSTRAALHAAHTLSTPVKIGVKVVARTQALTWSLQHSLSYLESAFLLSKWLDTIVTAGQSPDGVPLHEDERQVLTYVQGILDEGEVDDTAHTDSHLSVRLVNLWARLLGQESIWPIVGLVGRILTSYARLLATCLCRDVSGTSPGKGKSDKCCTI